MDFERKRWGYMIAAMIIAICSGIGYTWSVFQKPLMSNFGWSIQAISLTFTIQILVSTMAPVFIGKYQKTLGVKRYILIGALIYTIGLAATMLTSSLWYLYIVYGVVVGFGISMLYPCLMAYGGKLFPEKTGMAAGLIACAYGGGSIIWAPLGANFIEQYGVHFVFILFACIFAVVMIPCSFFLKEVPDNFIPVNSQKKDKAMNLRIARDYSWREMVKTTRYYILVIMLTLGATAGLMIMGHASSILQEMQNYAAERASFIVGIISIFNALGRICFGSASDRFGRYQVMMLLFLLIGGSMIVLTASGGVMFVAALCTIGACYGGFASMFSPVCADNFGIKNLAVNYGFLYIAYGFAGVIGPQLAAAAKLMGNGYSLAFTIVAVLSAVGLLLNLYMAKTMKNYN